MPSWPTADRPKDDRSKARRRAHGRRGSTRASALSANVCAVGAWGWLILAGWWVCERLPVVGGGAARGWAGPMLVHQVSASVTSLGRGSDATVLDQHRGAGGGSAAFGGDVVGTDEIAMPAISTVGTGEVASGGFGDPGSTGRVGTGAGRAAFVDTEHGDASQGGFVGDGAQEVAATPGPEPPVVHRPKITVGDAAGVADDEGPDPLGDGPLDEVLGGFVVGLVDSTPGGGLSPALLGSELAPAFGAPLAPAGASWGPSCGPGPWCPRGAAVPRPAGPVPRPRVPARRCWPRWGE
jgi:hypothetical protein